MIIPKKRNSENRVIYKIDLISSIIYPVKTFKTRTNTYCFIQTAKRWPVRFRGESDRRFQTSTSSGQKAKH